MEQLVGQYLRFLHTVQTWNFRFVLFSTSNLTFYASHTVKIKWLIHNSLISQYCTGVGFVNYTSLNFRKSKQLNTQLECLYIEKRYLFFHNFEIKKHTLC